VDSIIVGQFVGLSAFAAVSATTQICNTLVRFFNGTSVGAGAVISRYFGAKDGEKLNKAIHTTMALTFLACIMLTAVGLVGCDWMLRRMSTPEDVFVEASLYLHIYFAGLSGLLIYNMGSSILRAVGDTRRPLYFLLICCGLNVLCDLVFVVCFHWGIAGVAIATVAAQAVSSCLVLRTLYRTGEDWRFRWRELRVDRQIAGQILKIGLPVGLQMAVVAFSNVFVQAYINVFDTACIAGWGSYTKLDQYMMLPIQSMGQAVTTFVSQNLGAKQLDRAKAGARIAFGIIFCISVFIAVGLWIFAPQLTSLFSPDREAIRYGTLFIRLCCPFAVFCCFNQILSGALRGAGISQIPMLITLCTHVFSRQVYLFFITKLIPGNVYAVGLGYPVGWLLCAAIVTLYYHGSHWERRYRKA
jgi:putative MATE family efflux protein